MARVTKVELSAHSSDAGWAAIRRLASFCALLSIVVAAAALLIAGLVYRGLTPEAITAALVAGSVCCLASIAALVATHLGNQLSAPIQGLLVSMLFRMGLPLAALILFRKIGGAYASAGVSTTILGVYLVALATETLLALRMMSKREDVRVSKAKAV